MQNKLVKRNMTEINEKIILLEKNLVLLKSENDHLKEELESIKSENSHLQNKWWQTEKVKRKVEKTNDIALGILYSKFGITKDNISNLVITTKDQLKNK